jgi:uncharacterized protein
VGMGNDPRQLFPLLEAQRASLVYSERAGELLCDAVHQGDLALLGYLLGIGVREEFLHKALALVVEYGSSTEIAELLLAFGASVQTKIVSGGYSLLTYAVRSARSSHLIPPLVAAGADIEERNVLGFSLLLQACGGLNIIAVGYLLDAGADVHAVTPAGANALHVVCRQTEGNNIEHWCTVLVKRLLESGVDPHQRTTDGLTPFDFAVHFGHQGAVALLERAGYKRL